MSVTQQLSSRLIFMKNKDIELTAREVHGK